MVPSTPFAPPPSTARLALGCLALLVPLAAVVAPPATAVQSDGAGDATVAYEGDRLVLESAPGQVVTGATALPAGSRVVVRIEAGGDRPFVRSRPATVGPDGGFEVRFDLRARPPTTNVTVSVIRDSRVLTSVPAAIVSADGTHGSRNGTDGTRGSPTTPGTTGPTTDGATPESDGRHSEPGSGPDPLPRSVGGVSPPLLGLLAVAGVALAAVLLRGR